MYFNRKNYFMISGYLGAKPEVKQKSNGKPFVKMSIAINKRFKNKQTGDVTEQTEWMPVHCDNPSTVEFIRNNLDKGHEITVHGELDTYTEPTGQKDDQGNEVKARIILLKAGDITWHGKAPADESANDGPQQPDEALPSEADVF